jgi:hypothetical protein
MRYNLLVFACGAGDTQRLLIPIRSVHNSKAGATNRLGFINALGKRRQTAKTQDYRQ